ncbi:MAG: hypothetical protein M3404_00625 [Actinomycetota bacterium]|nr:hypothetical protein [Actinomycetota bacterium]
MVVPGANLTPRYGLTELNRGRAFFTTPETLGDYVLVDLIEHKTARRSAS